MKRGDIVVLRAYTSAWYRRSDEELAVAEARDVAAGRYTDDGGEPLLYSRMGSIYIEQDVAVFVTRLKGLEWDTWWRRPKGLVEGLATIGGIPRYILFKRTSTTEET